MSGAAAVPVNIKGLEKASVLLISLGPKVAGEVLTHLSEEEVQRICAQIARQKSVAPDIERQVLEEFGKSKQSSLFMGGVDFAREVLEQIVGTDKAEEILQDIAAGSQGKPFEWLRPSIMSRLASALGNERPQVIAMVLAHLSIDKAADIISQLPEHIQGNAAHRLTSMQPVDKLAVKAVDRVLQNKLSRDGVEGDMAAVGGLQSLVAILNNADRSTENKILEYLERLEPRIAEAVRQLMFVFEDIAKLDDRAIQATLREVEPEVLRMALKGASEDIRELLYRNMSERATESLKEDLALMGPARRKDVEAAQRRIVGIIRHLDEIGEISVRDSDDDVIE